MLVQRILAYISQARFDDFQMRLSPSADQAAGDLASSFSWRWLNYRYGWQVVGIHGVFLCRDIVICLPLY